MNGVPFTDFGDFVNHLLPDFKNRPAFDVAFERQNYVVVDEWFSQDKYESQGGNQVRWEMILGHNGSARMVRPMQVTPRSHTDNFKYMFAPWVTAQGMVNYDEQIASNFSTDTELADYMMGQWFVGVQAKLDLLDTQGFAVPDNSTDDLNACGVPFWVVFANSGTTDYSGSFGGQTLIYGDGTTTTTVGGIDRSTETLARNYTGNYSGTVDAQCIDLIERGLIFTNFKPPKDIAAYAKTNKPKRAIHWGLTAQSQYQRLRNQGTDPRNGDVRPFGVLGGAPTLSGVDTVPMANLESRAHSPIYVLDKPNFFPIVKKGWFMRKTKAMNDVDQPNFYTVYVHTQFNFGCRIPRNQAVYHVAF